MPPARPTVREDLILRQVEDDFIVYDPVSDITALLNASAAVVLNMCDGTRTAEDIAAEVMAAFGGEKESISREVQKALGELSARGFFGPGGDD